MQRQSASQLVEIEHLRQEKESTEMQLRVSEKELLDCKDKLNSSTRTLGNITGNVAAQDSEIIHLKGIKISLNQNNLMKNNCVCLKRN